MLVTMPIGRPVSSTTGSALYLPRIIRSTANAAGVAGPIDITSRFMIRPSGAKRGADVTIAGQVWQSWTDTRGDYALARSFPAPKGKFPEQILVGGSATPTQIREYVASLR